MATDSGGAGVKPKPGPIGGGGKPGVQPLPKPKPQPSPGPSPGVIGFEQQLEQAIPGLPAALLSQIANILQADPTDAGLNRAFAFLRGQDWFKQNFAGFNEGAQTGLFNGSLGGLSEYRGWKTQVQDIYQHYYGRQATSMELSGFGASGYAASTVEQIGQGYSIQQAQSPEWQYELGAFGSGQLSAAEQTAYGQLLAGKGSDLGTRVQQRIQLAMQKMQTVFSGTLASSGISPTKSLDKLPDIGA